MSKSNCSNVAKSQIEIDEVVYLFLIEMKNEEGLKDVGEAVRRLLIRA